MENKTTPETKICKKCLILKPLTDYQNSKDRANGKQDWCRLCKREYYDLNKERLRKHIRNNMLQREYGISQEEFDYILRKQNEQCAICGLHAKNVKRKNLHVDHNHKTKKIRGLLCNNCNRGIGHLKDSIKNLKAAVKYLEERGTYHE
jgi:nitrate/TMAO reductase-like tetraheme cytochrome c subunit